MNPTLELNFFPPIQIGMNTRKQKRKQMGGQPLSYTNPTYNEPSALPGVSLLHSAGTIARPEISQRGGTQMVYTDTGKWIPWTERGADLILPTPQPQKGGQPLSYTVPEYREVSSLPGAPLLHSNGTIARPEIAMKGGFSPSIMSNLVGNAAYLTPLAMTAAYRLLSNKTRKQRGGNGEEWETYRQQAKLMLQGVAPGKANGKWVNKLAKIIKEKEKKNVAVALAEFAEEKGVDKKEAVGRPVFATKLNEWEYDQRQARKELAKYGEPSVAEITHLAALRTGRKGKEGNANAYLDEFRQRYQARKNAQKAKAQEKEEKKIRKQIAEAEKAVVVPKPPKAVPPAVNQRPWAEIREEAKAELAGMGKKLRRGNTMKYASMKRLKDQARINEFLTEFRARPDAAAEREESKEEESKEDESNEEFKENKPPAKPKRRTYRVPKGREEWNGYQQGAKKMLEKIGPATSAEISELAKLIKNGENVRGYLNEFEARVEATKVRVARLEKEREERKTSDEESKYDEEESNEEVAAAPLEKPKDALPPPPPPPPAPVPRMKAQVAAPIAPVKPGTLAQFQQRLAELAKKYPGGT
jgi:hypothetical protein